MRGCIHLLLHNEIAGQPSSEKRRPEEGEKDTSRERGRPEDFYHWRILGEKTSKKEVCREKREDISLNERDQEFYREEVIIEGEKESNWGEMQGRQKQLFSSWKKKANPQRKQNEKVKKRSLCIRHEGRPVAPRKPGEVRHLKGDREEGRSKCTGRILKHAQ